MELYRANKGLLFMLARRYAHVDNAIDTEDLVQAGYEGLVEAERTYDANRGKSWAGWAAWYISRAMRRAVGITRERAHLHTISLDEPLSDDEGAETWLDMLADESLPDADVGLLEAERAITVRAAVDRLEDRKREVIQRHDLQGRSLAKTGEGIASKSSATRNTS